MKAKQENEIKKKSESAEITQESIDKQKEILKSNFDVNFSINLSNKLLKPIDEVYFRSKLIGFDEVVQRSNKDSPLIYASNHSGMAFPWDAIIFISCLAQKYDMNVSLVPRALVAPMLSATPIMSPFVIWNFWKRNGGIDATFLNFETAMQMPESDVLIFPEGVPGIGKGWSRKYQLQRFSSSFIKMSLKYKTDIIPISTINGEYINPFAWNSPFLNRIAQKIGVPFLPLSVQTIFIFLQPWTFFLAFPANLFFVRGKKISPYQWTDKEYDKISHEEFQEIAEKVRLEMQKSLDENVKLYGKKPFKFWEMLKLSFKKIKFFPYYYPFAWPFAFIEFERLAKKNEYHKLDLGFLSVLKILFRNPILIAFYIPIFGWLILLWLGKRNLKRKY